MDLIEQLENLEVYSASDVLVTAKSCMRAYFESYDNYLTEENFTELLRFIIYTDFNLNVKDKTGFLRTINNILKNIKSHRVHWKEEISFFYPCCNKTEDVTVYLNVDYIHCDECDIAHPVSFFAEKLTLQVIGE